jgi:hypothetical protein
LLATATGLTAWGLGYGRYMALDNGICCFGQDKSLCNKTCSKTELLWQ